MLFCYLLYLSSARKARGGKSEGWRLTKQELISFVGGWETSGLKSVLMWSQLTGLKRQCEGVQVSLGREGKNF